MDRKAVTPIIVVLLFLIMVGISYFSMERWYFPYVSKHQAQIELDKESSVIRVLELKTNPSNLSQSILGVKNYGRFSQDISKLTINGNLCVVTNSTVFETMPIYSNCTVTIGESYEVVLYTNKRIFSRAFTVTE